MDGGDPEAEVVGAARRAAAELLRQTARFVERVLAEIEQARTDALKDRQEAADLLRRARALQAAAGSRAQRPDAGAEPAGPGSSLEQAVRDYRQRAPADGSAAPRPSPAAPRHDRQWWWLKSPG